MVDDMAFNPSRGRELNSNNYNHNHNNHNHNHNHHRDVEEGSSDRLPHNGGASVFNDRFIGESNGNNERNPLLGGIAPVYSKIMESKSGTIKPTINTNAGDETISFREILPRDRWQLQKLFEEWFPVQYKDEFYDQLCNDRTMGDQTLYTLLATVPEALGDGETIIACLLGCKLSAHKLNDASRSLLIPGYKAKYDDQDHDTNSNNKNPSSTNSELDRALDELESCGGPKVNNSSVKEKEKDGEDDVGTQGIDVFYIMTLGVIKAYRKRGLASYLLERALEDQIVTAPEADDSDVAVEPNQPNSVEETKDAFEEFHANEMYQSNNNNKFSEPICETAYLHVIIQNQAAIQFYEKLGFDRLREIANYYTIDDQKHNCYLYAKFFDKESGIQRQKRANGLLVSYFKSLVGGISKNSRHVVNFLVRWVTLTWSSICYYWVLDTENSRNAALAAAKTK